MENYLPVLAILILADANAVFWRKLTAATTETESMGLNPALLVTRCVFEASVFMSLSLSLLICKMGVITREYM